LASFTSNTPSAFAGVLAISTTAAASGTTILRGALFICAS
jgi:hypothetical protein